MSLARMLAVALVVAPMVSGDSITSWRRKHNTAFLELSRGTAELEWITPSTFRHLRCSTGNCPSRPGVDEPVEFQVRQTDEAIEFTTSYLRVHVSRSDATVSVRSWRGKTLMEEVKGEALFERRSAPGEKLYGLGPRAAPLDLRGSVIETTRPLLISDTGFGQFFSAPAEYRFDLARSQPERVRVTAPFARHLEYFFYYGPGPKEVLEEHMNVAGSIGAVRLEHVEVLSSADLPKFASPLAGLDQLAQASFSGILAPAFDLAGVAGTPLAPFLPILFRAGASEPDRSILEMRRRFASYLFTYLAEARHRGLPVIRPLAMQYSQDPEAVRNSQQFMAGDELLLPTNNPLYLPMGFWTDLCSNTRYPGRQTIPIIVRGFCPVFAHNGSIVPIDAGSRIELHYFPRLGAEFFLTEADGQTTQAHAAPAGDYLRLQIESKAARDYEWVVHHVSPATAVHPQLPVRYDAEKRNLHVRLYASADSDIIVNISLEEPL